MVDLAQRQAIWNHRVSELVAISNDVSSVEETHVSKVAHRTTFSIRMENTLTKRCLVKPLYCEASYIATSNIVDHCGRQVPLKQLDVLACNAEGFGQQGCQRR